MIKVSVEERPGHSGSACSHFRTSSRPLLATRKGSGNVNHGDRKYGTETRVMGSYKEERLGSLGKRTLSRPDFRPLQQALIAFEQATEKYIY